jgi:8-oxo-dGTP diphosphatase
MANRAGISSARAPVVAVGAVIWNDRREIVLIRRGHPPREQEWSIPGGKIEWGETVEAALKREVREETGLTIEILGLIDIVDSLIPGRTGAFLHHHVLLDFAARRVSGKLRAGDDAQEARWVPFAALENYPMWDETRRILTSSAQAIARSRKRGLPRPRVRKGRQRRRSRD